MTGIPRVASPRTRATPSASSISAASTRSSSAAMSFNLPATWRAQRSTASTTMVEKRLDHKAQETGDYLAAKLEGLKQHGVVREVRGKGLLRGVEFWRDPESKAPFPELGLALKKTALNNGLIMRVDPHWFAVAPALIAEKADIDELCDLIERSLLDALEMVGH